MFRSLKLTHHIAAKLILAILLVILISTLSTSLYFYEVSTEVVKTNVRTSSVQLARQTADSLSYMLSVGSDTSDLLYNDVRLQRLIAESGQVLPLNQKATNDEDIVNTLNNITFSSSSVRMANILREGDSSWGSGVFSQAKLDRYSLRDFDWIRKAEEADGRIVWSRLQYDLFSGPADDTELVLPVSRVLKDFTTLNNMAYLIVNLDGRTLLSKISGVRLGQSGAFFVTDSAGMVMLDAEVDKVGKPVADPALFRHILTPGESEFEYKRDEIAYYGVKQALSNGWTLVGVVPVGEITGQMEQLRNSLFLSAGLFALLAILIGLVIARMITKPIKELTGQMKVLETGNFAVRTSIHTKDEIGLLSRQFNRMTSRIDALMQQVREEQDSKQEAQLRAVMHRINPHFLFNTLNTLRWLVKFGEHEKAYKGLSALSLMLEFNMAKAGPLTTIDEELDVIRQYLIILQLRYNLTFRLHVELAESAGPYPIPRMLIQPIVENAIFHGIVPKGTDGDIRIRVADLPGQVRIEVTDNGVGMTAVQLARLQQLEQAAMEQQIGIGLKHVDESVRLYFAPGSGVRVESRKGEGTAITLILIKKEQE